MLSGERGPAENFFAIRVGTPVFRPGVELFVVSVSRLLVTAIQVRAFPVAVWRLHHHSAFPPSGVFCPFFLRLFLGLDFRLINFFLSLFKGFNNTFRYFLPYC